MTRPTKSASRAALLVVLALAIAACGSKGKVREPAELTSIAAPEVSVRQAWSGRAGNGSKGRRAGLSIAAENDAVFVAEADGNVYAFNSKTGNAIWRTDTGSRVSGGPGVAGNLILVGTLDAEVIALSRADGSERWRAPVSSEVLAAPAGNGEYVVARTVDGRLFGLSALGGQRLWTFDRSVPSLTLRGLSRPLIAGRQVVVGLDNGRVAALRLSDGEPVWEETVAAPAGRTELERITDIDGELVAGPDGLMAMSYGGEVAAIDVFAGEVSWRREIRSQAGGAMVGERVIVADEDGIVWALDAATGAAAWKQEGLKYRRLSAPVEHAGFVAVADFDGYVHYLAPSDGHFVGRVHPLGDPVEAPLVVNDGVLYVMDNEGRIAALEANTPAR